MTADTPQPRHLWTTHSRRTAYTGGLLRVEIDDVTAPAGDRFDLHRVVLPRAAVALVVDPGDQVLLLRTYRHLIEREGWELPGGLVEPGEDPETAAAREAAEETGWEPVGPARTLAAFEPLPGSATAPMSVHLWSAARPSGRPLDPYEPGRAEWVPLAEVARLARTGGLLGAGSLVGVLAYLAERAPSP
jgi:ADP-ribose pyrophosphatase